ncbi:Short-chain dehydrogenase [Rubrivivax sp. A210]|uniref:SDR family oxidoreductase n=1 Tax=Rubrivivax sp. A210 TaxID=2772301 RepID=UPI00191B0731|nr:SDR family oxidoreductase [Rubrivivax sp. A210]CAD5373837.1 Short-chain dehydrogenase [Rubrivivax sp. A210]
MISTRLDGKRVLLTQSGDFMGPALNEVFSQLGAEVIADPRALDDDPALPAAVVGAAGRIDVLLIHLALPAPSTPAGEISDAEWRTVFAHLVDPMPRLVAAVLPQMIERRSGRILVMGSAAALRGQKRTGSYSAARGAQLAYVQSVALELVQHGIQINAIAQNFVANPTYYGAEVQANPRFQERLKREVPLGRLVSAEEDAQFAAYLCSDAASCFVGQIFPISGGWANR